MQFVERKPDKKSSLRSLEFMPEASTKNTSQEFHLWRRLLVRERIHNFLYLLCARTTKYGQGREGGWYGRSIAVDT